MTAECQKQGTDHPGGEMTASWSSQDQLQKVGGLIRVKSRAGVGRGGPRQSPRSNLDDREAARREPSEKQPAPAAAKGLGG